MSATPAGNAVPQFQPYKTGIAFCLMAAAILAWWQDRLPAPTKITKSRPAVFNEFDADNESAWMARQIGRDILDTIAFAQTRKHPSNSNVHFDSGSNHDGTKHLFTASFDGMAEKKLTITAVEYFWSPAGFAPWTSSLLSAASAQIPKTSHAFNADLLSALTAPTAETLIREDKRLSEALTKEPLDPELHEEAALLIGSFAMREAATSSFYDIRRYLSKMTAHLALAQAIREKRGQNGDLAEAILCSLTGRETPALSLMDRLQQNARSGADPSANNILIWGRALRLHNTGDYRQLPDPENGTLLERLEYVRALRMSIGTAAASKFVTSHDMERLPEWGEQILRGNITVEDGHRWGRSTLEMELDATATHYRYYFGKQIEPEKFADALNIDWEQFPREGSDNAALHILGWGAWAEQHQRQLCGLIHTVSCWLGELLGLPDSAKKFESKMTTEFGSLRLFPLIGFYGRTEESSKLWIERIRNGFRQHREWITYNLWSRARQAQIQLWPPGPIAQSSPVHRQRKMRPEEMEQLRRANAPKQDPLFANGNWWSPGVPFGTLFDLSHRGGTFSQPGEIEAAMTMAPHNREVILAHLTRTTKSRPTPEHTEAAFSGLSGYDLSAMKRIAEAFMWDPKKYAQKFTAVCSFDPNEYVTLGNYLAAHQDEAGAVRAFQNAFDHATDRIHVSNTMDWLVNYYFEHDKKEEAYKIASEGAGVYSQAGLVVFADLLDRMGQVDNAELYFKNAYERYPESSKDDLFDFYARHRGKSPAYAAEEAKLLALIFPKGVQHVTLSDFQGQPNEGIILNASSPRTDKAGLKVSDVIVAVNGWRVHNWYEYYAARAPSTNPNVKFIVWRAGNYLELDSFFPRRPDFCGMTVYKGGSGNH
jgi:hypothetical protein